MSNKISSYPNRALRPLGVQMVRGSSADPAIRSFLSARKTIAAARRAGLSLSDYIDQFSAEPGTTASTVEAMLRLAELRGHVDRICEIGAGTGRYAERVIAALERYNRNGRQRGGHRQCSQFLPPSHLRAQGRKPASPGGPWGCRVSRSDFCRCQAPCAFPGCRIADVTRAKYR